MYILCMLMVLFTHLFGLPTLVHREEFENIRTEDGREIKIQYFISQQCDIENNQTNKTHVPITKQAVPETPAVQPQENKAQSWPSFSLSKLWGTLGIGTLGCAGYGIYHLFTKFNLFTLGKACFATTGWSMWKSKNSNDLSDASDEENDLLVDILNKYQTDRYTTAIAQFMQDVEEEEDVLNKYIKQAESTQKSIFRFAFADLSTDIMQAKGRLSNLQDLKKTVFGWLHKRSPSYCLNETL